MLFSDRLRRVAKTILALRGAQGFDIPYELITFLEKAIEQHFSKYFPAVTLNFQTEEQHQFDLSTATTTDTLIEKRVAQFEDDPITISFYGSKVNDQLLQFQFQIEIVQAIITKIRNQFLRMEKNITIPAREIAALTSDERWRARNILHSLGSSLRKSFPLEVTHYLGAPNSSSRDQIAVRVWPGSGVTDFSERGDIVDLTFKVPLTKSVDLYAILRHFFFPKEQMRGDLNPLAPENTKIPVDLLEDIGAVKHALIPRYEHLGDLWKFILEFYKILKMIIWRHSEYSFNELVNFFKYFTPEVLNQIKQQYHTWSEEVIAADKQQDRDWFWGLTAYSGKPLSEIFLGITQKLERSVNAYLQLRDNISRAGII